MKQSNSTPSPNLEFRDLADHLARQLILDQPTATIRECDLVSKDLARAILRLAGGRSVTDTVACAPRAEVKAVCMALADLLDSTAEKL